MGSREWKEEYYNYVVRERRNLYEILFDFNIVNISLDYILECISIQNAREYSISSSYKMNPKIVSITVNTLEYETIFKRKI